MCTHVPAHGRSAEVNVANLRTLACVLDTSCGDIIAVTDAAYEYDLPRIAPTHRHNIQLDYHKSGNPERHVFYAIDYTDVGNIFARRLGDWDRHGGEIEQLVARHRAKDENARARITYCYIDGEGYVDDFPYGLHPCWQCAIAK